MIHIIFLITGLCLGSFLNVVFSRKDWYIGRSRCDICGYQLKWYDNIPIISYIVLRGKCRKCGNKIDCEHLFSELIMGTSFFCGSFFLFENSLSYGVTYFISLILIAVCAIEDMKEQMVYSWLLNLTIIATLILKCLEYIFTKNYANIIFAVAVVILLKIIFFVLSKIFKDKIGSGDFDIFIVMVILQGFFDAIFSLTIGCIIGVIICLFGMFLKKMDKREPLPLIPFLFIGMVIYLLVSSYF